MVNSILSAAIGAVIFDCDGVLVDSEFIAIRGERAALAEIGLDYSSEDYVRRFTGLHDAAFFEALSADFRAAFGAAPPADFEARVIAGRGRERDALRIVSGADAALARSRAKVGKVAVASSSRAQFLESKLRRTGLWDLAAPHIYSADLVARGKPAPDIFLFAAERIGADPKRSLVVEDSINGVLAARAAGMKVCGFLGGAHCFDGHGARLQEAGADFLAASFEAFLSALDA